MSLGLILARNERQRPKTCALSSQEAQKIILEHEPNIPLNVLLAHAPAGFQEVAVFIREHLGQNLSAVVPFINQLVQNPGIGVLGDEAGSEKLDAHSLDLF